MAVLKDYLGSLIRDITYSRVIADQESAKRRLTEILPEDQSTHSNMKRTAK